MISLATELQEPSADRPIAASCFDPRCRAVLMEMRISTEQQLARADLYGPTFCKLRNSGPVTKFKLRAYQAAILKHMAGITKNA